MAVDLITLRNTIGRALTYDEGDQNFTTLNNKIKIDNRDPIATDDNTQKIQTETIWINSDSKDIFYCSDNAINTAVWNLLGNLAGGGGIALNPSVTVTADYTITNEQQVVFVDASLNNVTITLPAPTNYIDISIIIKAIGEGNSVTVALTSGDFLNPDLAPLVFFAFDIFTEFIIKSDGTDFSVTQSYSS